MWKSTSAVMQNPLFVLKEKQERYSAEIALRIFSHFSWLFYEDKFHNIFCKGKMSLNVREAAHLQSIGSLELCYQYQLSEYQNYK